MEVTAITINFFSAGNSPRTRQPKTLSKVRPKKRAQVLPNLGTHEFISGNILNFKKT